MPIPIIDLFAGPGGLGEGFASLKCHNGQPFFEIGLSIEKDVVAHRTLTLRAAFRRLRSSKDVKHYYSYIRGEIDEAAFRRIPAVASAFEHAATEARCLELGKSDEAGIDREIRATLKGQETWVLIGGPPCQAYSLAGRSRRANDKDFHKDEKHFLYKEYLRIIQVHKPTIFVMENVKGLLSSKHSGDPMFEKIIADLSSPVDGLEYEIRSFTKRGNSNSLEPVDYLIHSERYGIPQSRHRVILLGVRKGLGVPQHQLLEPVSKPVTVKQTIDDLPRIRSRLSRGDSLEAWRKAVLAAPAYVKGWRAENEAAMIDSMRTFAVAATSSSTGGAFIPREYRRPKKPTELQQWLHDQSLGGICQHEARSHMASDLARYLFAAAFAHSQGNSPRLDVFPFKLLPDHINVQFWSEAEAIPFKDRFRVQCRNEPATTVVAHIAKDGHYYIHYDPSQCRSLTVREAARLQTFPDNYFFAGNRTEQYTQIGNAVPPLLAHKLARIVRSLLNEMNRKKRKQASDRMHNKPMENIRHNVSLQVQVPLLAETD
ncbi:MAG: DNA (cytosine-5-)-methyltransferase [Hydrogenophilales bacterium 16-64-46]|nr:MAG: DNA (cytosine-5-)-methyltransferase [Hydrogenophilales bacterium 12-64-13]OYZ06923.1 MAG: DNA (cytosine-5-)-methyltransferase [Hydrogenophilales bacterium 16-64-46]OZA39583.1 MAG: DNA (cytosine-5-)-methyltransferase [Hydrogenophilales bacterium 17-64-34]